MKFWANACKAAGYLWLVMAGFILLVGIVGTWITEGVSAVPGSLSLLHVANWVVLLVAILPGLGLLLLASKLKAEVSGADGLVRAYGAVLEGTADALVVDQNRLPASKQEIKSAILGALQKTEDPKRRSFLQNAYIDLAMFQTGVGKEPVRFESAPTPAPEGYEAVVAVASSLAERNPEIKHWSAVVAKESEELIRELRSAGFGSGSRVKSSG
jgi:hypothetical protein